MMTMKFEKATDGSWVRRAPTQAQGQGQGQVHPGVEEAEIREMGVGVDPQSGYQQRELELDISPLQSQGAQFEATFFEPMMSEPTYTASSSTSPSFTKPSSGPAFTEPLHIEIPPPQAPLTPDHAPWMDLSAQISSLGTRMEEFIVVSDTRFYSIEDRMDQYQVSFTSQFEYLQQKIGHIEDHLESQHEEMMPYLGSVFPPPPPQP